MRKFLLYTVIIAMVVLITTAPFAAGIGRRIADNAAVTGFLDEYFGEDHDFVIANSQVLRGPTDWMGRDEIWRFYYVRSRSGVIGAARIEFFVWDGEILGVWLRRPDERLSIPLEEWRDGGREWLRRYDDAVAVSRFLREHFGSFHGFYAEEEEIIEGPNDRLSESEIFRRFVRRAPHTLHEVRIEFLVWGGKIHSASVICPDTGELVPFEEWHKQR